MLAVAHSVLHKWLPATSQLVTPAYCQTLPKPNDQEGLHASKPQVLSVVDCTDHTVRYISIPADNENTSVSTSSSSPMEDLNNSHMLKFKPPQRVFAKTEYESARVVALSELPKSSDLVTLQSNGIVRVWEVRRASLDTAAKTWRRLFGITKQLPLRLIVDSGEMFLLSFLQQL
jgi:hypothetical protein